MDGQLLQLLTLSGTSTMRDVALAFGELSGISIMRQQISIDAEVVRPDKLIASIKHHPVTLTLHVLPETSLIRMVSLSGNPNTESQFVVDRVTWGADNHKEPYN